jgi:CubicO group peptidase (beta-lactamase class C family)
MQRRDFLKSSALLGLNVMLPAGGTALAATRQSHFSWKLLPPEAGGLSPVGFEGMRAAIQKNIDAKTIAGAVTAVARHGKLVCFEALGLADFATGKPVKTDLLFRMMSSTKVVTAVATLMMLDDGKLALEDPVSKFIPSFKGQKVAVAPPGTTELAEVEFVPAVRDITIRDLLTHTSGLSSSGGIPAIAELRNKVHGPDETLASVVPQFGNFALDFQPGTLFRYSPLDGMDTLLYIVELTSGISAERFFRERIFQPLDMRSSYFNTPATERERIVQLYNVKDGKFEAQQALFDNGPSRYISGAGGLTSCAHDMLNFELMLLNRGSFNDRRLLKPETVSLMARNHVGSLFAEWFPPLTAGNGFGLGVRVLEDDSKSDGRAVGAFGWGGAYGTETWADPKLDLAAVMLIQGSSNSSGVRVDFTQALRKAIVD